MILKLVIRNQLPRDSVILIKAPVEYVEIHQQKKTNISKITAPLLLKLGGSLDHMYTKAQNFLAPTLKCPHGIGHRKTISSPVLPKLTPNLLLTYSKLTRNLLQTYFKLTPKVLQTYSKLTQNFVRA